MRKNLIFLVLILVTFLVQSTLRAIVPMQYTLPNLLLILTCSIGLLRGKKAGMWTGFLAGFLYDLFFGSVFGLTMICLLYVGYAGGFLYKVFFDTDTRIPMAAAGVSDLACNLVIYVVRVLMRQSVPFGSYVTGSVLPEVIATILCTIPLYHVYRLISRRITLYEEEVQQSPWLRR